MERRHGICVLAKDLGEHFAQVIVAVRLESLREGRSIMRTELQRPAELSPGPECLEQYRTDERLFAACQGCAYSGAFYATRRTRDRYGVVITRLGGQNLPARCGEAFALAAAFACRAALGELDPESSDDIYDPIGWRPVKIAPWIKS